MRRRRRRGKGEEEEEKEEKMRRRRRRRKRRNGSFDITSPLTVSEHRRGQEPKTKLTHRGAVADLEGGGFFVVFVSVAILYRAAVIYIGPTPADSHHQ